jgi:hypothetical protein
MEKLIHEMRKQMESLSAKYEALKRHLSQFDSGGVSK